MKRWRLLKEEHQSPSWALAVEEAIARTVGDGLAPNTLRLWKTWNAIVIGRFQCPKLEAVFSSCLRYRTSIARRFTGGGTVYQDMGNLNFAISMHKDPWAISNLSDFFKKVGLTVAESLKYLGASAKYKRMSVYVSDRKLSGLAGMATKGVVFVHGSLLVDSNLDILHRVLNFDKGTPKKRFVRSAVKEVTTLKDELNRKIQMSEVEETLVKCFEKEFRSVLVPEELTKGELELAQNLFMERYARLQWILATCQGCAYNIMDAPILETLASYGTIEIPQLQNKLAEVF